MYDEKYMEKAILLAKEASENGEVPVGAIIVDENGIIIGTGRNRCEEMSATRHAEIEAIEQASARRGNWRLDGCSLYVTLEPCPMCAGAIINARVSTIVFGAREEKSGSVGSVIDLFQENYGFKPVVYSGVLKETCAELLREFFKEKRLKDG